MKIFDAEVQDGDLVLLCVKSWGKSMHYVGWINFKMGFEDRLFGYNFSLSNKSIEGNYKLNYEFFKLKKVIWIKVIDDIKFTGGKN